MTLPHAAGRVVPLRKIAGYLLNRVHEEGASKAAFFERFGFSIDAPETLAAALHDHPVRNDVVRTVRGAFRTKYIVRCTIETPDGRNPCVVSVWAAEEADPTRPRLLTAYPGR